MVLFMTQAEVYTHATLKACQISSVAGVVAGTLYKTFTYRNFRAHTIWLGCLTGARYGMLLGVPVGIGATLYRMRNVEQQVRYLSSVLIIDDKISPNSSFA